MKNNEKLECLFCDGEFKEKDEVCPTCGADIISMIPLQKPKEVEYPHGYDFRLPIMILLSGNLISLCVIALIAQGVVKKLINLPDYACSIIAILIILVLLYLITWLYHCKAVKKYAKYKRQMKLYRKFVMSEEEQKNKLKKEEEERERCYKAFERERELEYQKFDMSLFYKYGVEIASVNTRFCALRLYKGYLIETSGPKIKEEINLNGYVDCELINSKMEDKIYILLKDPSTQSKADVLFNGRNGKVLVLDILKLCSESEKNKINQFFLKLKREINK